MELPKAIVEALLVGNRAAVDTLPLIEIADDSEAECLVGRATEAMHQFVDTAPHRVPINKVVTTVEHLAEMSRAEHTTLNKRVDSFERIRAVDFKWSSDDKSRIRSLERVGEIDKTRTRSHSERIGIGINRCHDVGAHHSPRLRLERIDIGIVARRVK